eukprot:gene198-238_t
MSATNNTENNSNGEFKRISSTFRNIVEKGGKYEPEAGRYHLYVSVTCPWAHRTLLMYKFKALEKVIGLSMTSFSLHPELGWQFTCDESSGDSLYGSKTIRDIYQMSEPGYDGKCTVPVFWDTKTKTIVNNESSEIIKIFNSAFDEFLTDSPAVDLYPESLRQDIDTINDYVYDNVNNGVYKAGFATGQDAYNSAYENLFKALDVLEDRLGKSKFLVGDKMTLADIKDYPILSNYLRSLYQIPVFKETTHLNLIKRGYYGLSKLNPSGVYPLGPNVDYLNIPHTRK